MMRYTLHIAGGLCSSQAAGAALAFGRACLQKGHAIDQVFFSQAGVENTNQQVATLSDEFDAVQSWADFAKQHSIPLIVCSTAAEKRGVLGQEQAQDYAKPTANLHPQYKIAGLATLLQAAQSADRCITFK